MSVLYIVRTIKSLTAREVFTNHPTVEKDLCGGNFLTSGFYANRVEQYVNKDIIKNVLRIREENIKQFIQGNYVSGNRYFGACPGGIH